MSDVTAIEWTDHTFNPWWGCSRVSPACRFCYADRDARRYGHELWHRHGQRRMLSERNWQRPLKWNRDAERAGVPEKVFCASMADVFEDHPDLEEPRKRLWDLIEATPWLRWQLLTKRPENVAEMASWGNDWPSWVWLGVSAENQRWADTRIPVLLQLPAKVRFISAEPLVGPIDLGFDHECGDPPHWTCPVMADWLIIGGESGPRARPMQLEWARGLLAQCRESEVSTVPFVKQLGSVLGRELSAGPKGGDMARWPADLRVREFPYEAGLAEAVSDHGRRQAAPHAPRRDPARQVLPAHLSERGSMINGNDIGDRCRHRYLARRSMTASEPVILTAATGTRPAVARSLLQRLAVTGRDWLGWPGGRRADADRCSYVCQWLG